MARDRDGYRGGGGGRNNQDGYKAGRDAAYVKPFFIPDAELLARDDSGGPEWDPYTQQWGDGGYVTGEKPHLSARDGFEGDEFKGDEISSEPRERAAKRAEGEKSISPEAPAKSKKLAKE